MTLERLLTIIASTIIATVMFFTGRCSNEAQTINAVPASYEQGEQKDKDQKTYSDGSDSKSTEEEKK